MCKALVLLLASVSEAHQAPMLMKCALIFATAQVEQSPAAQLCGGPKGAGGFTQSACCSAGDPISMPTAFDDPESVC